VNSDTHSMASWCYAPQNGEFVSYDTIDVALGKARWINGEGLGGAMYWELSGCARWLIGR
jgi:chitinase